MWLKPRGSVLGSRRWRLLWSALPTELSTATESAHACTVHSQKDKRPETEELGFNFCLIYLSGHG